LFECSPQAPRVDCFLLLRNVISGALSYRKPQYGPSLLGHAINPYEYATDKRSTFCPPIMLIKARGYFGQFDGVPRWVTTTSLSSRPAPQRGATSLYRRGSPRHLRAVLLRSTTAMWQCVCFPAPSLPLRKRCNGILAWSSAGSSDTA